MCSGLVLSPDDGILQNIPFRVAAAKIVRSVNLPLWNPFLFSGMPLLGAAQGGILFPLNWFYLLWSVSSATNLMVVTTYMTAALGAFLYSRRIGHSIPGAIVTSLVWQAGGFMINQISHINIIQTAALLPWGLWAIERYVGHPNRTRGAVIALIIALQIFAGHQQTFAYVFLLSCAYALVMAAGNTQTRTLYFKSLAFIGIGVLLAAVQILPTWELLRNSLRATASYDFFSSFSMPKRSVLTLLAPFIFGGGDGRLFRAPYIGQSFYTEYVPYAGLLAITLAAMALITKSDRRTKFWAVTAVIGLLLAFGRYSPFSIYKLIYLIPVLNLFRVPARHLVEVQFAIAVLAGRGLTKLSLSQGNKDTMRRALIIASVVLVLTFLTVTWFRPADFRLSREVPLTLLRAPELFMPIVMAALSLFAVWLFTRGRRGTTAILLAVLAFDLVIWGQFSGWYMSSWRTPAEYWRVPESVNLLREKVHGDSSSYRVLTTHWLFDPVVNQANPNPGWVLWTEPDIYMMHGIQNAAGYDGFGLQRYSDLAGQMKLWGELADPNATLRGNSRELDILNTRYVIARRERPTEATTVEEQELSVYPAASDKHGDFQFAQNDLSLPKINDTRLLHFRVQPVEADHVALLTNLSFAEDVPDNTPIARLRLRTWDGRTFDFVLRVGVDTADWAYDRADIKARIKHKRAVVATSYDVGDAEQKYQGHTYLTAFALPERATIESGELALEVQPKDTGLGLTMYRMSLVDAARDKTYPLPKAMISVENRSPGESATVDRDDRWKFIARGLDVNIYENLRALPRAWMTSEVRVLDEKEMLQTIRTGSLPDGKKWEPERMALLESQLSVPLRNAAADAHVEVKNYQPNRVDLQTSASGDSLLVLSENHYPGWRALIDGQGAEMLRVNYGLRGVVVPAGTHEVAFVYGPWSVMAGFLISVVTSIALVTFVVSGKRNK